MAEKKSAARKAGPSFRKSPPDLVAAFDKAFPDDPRAERRQMFGYPAGFVNGNLFAGLHQESLMVRLPPDPREELLRLPGAGPFEPMPGRPMAGYAVLPPEMARDPGAAAAWVRRAFEHTASLPPKEAKKAPTKKAPAKKAGR